MLISLRPIVLVTILVFIEIAVRGHLLLYPFTYLQSFGLLQIIWIMGPWI